MHWYIPSGKKSMVLPVCQVLAWSGCLHVKPISSFGWNLTACTCAIPHLSTSEKTNNMKKKTIHIKDISLEQQL